MIACPSQYTAGTCSEKHVNARQAVHMSTFVTVNSDSGTEFAIYKQRYSNKHNQQSPMAKNPAKIELPATKRQGNVRQNSNVLTLPESTES